MLGGTDLEIDSIRALQQNPPYPRSDEEELHSQLIDINEELLSEELEVLKFLCYDLLPGNIKCAVYNYLVRGTAIA